VATPNRSHAALTVIIPTAGRKASLRETLAELANRTGSDLAEVVVVDNAPQPDLDESDVSLPGLEVRLLREPRPGKSFALNRAIESGVGEIVGVLDDDMTPMPGWIDAVIASVRARPQFDIFSRADRTWCGRRASASPRGRATGSHGASPSR